MTGAAIRDFSGDGGNGTFEGEVACNVGTGRRCGEAGGLKFVATGEFIAFTVSALET